MRRILLALSIFLLGTHSPAWAAEHCMKTNEGAAWQSKYPEIYHKLMGYFTCYGAGDPVACNVFVARAAEGVYGVSDFKRPDGTYLTANKIMDFVKTNNSWSKLGMASDQSVLNDAAAGAQDHLIIAVMSDQPHGHVALVLPGDPMHSGNWKLKVPNSASAFLDRVDRAYVYCRLSWAFQDPAKVELWWRPKGN